METSENFMKILDKVEIIQNCTNKDFMKIYEKSQEIRVIILEELNKIKKSQVQDMVDSRQEEPEEIICKNLRESMELNELEGRSTF